MSKKIAALLGAEAKDLLEYQCTGISKDQLHLPGTDFVDRIFVNSDRPANVLNNLQEDFQHRTHGGHGLCVIPAD